MKKMSFVLTLILISICTAFIHAETMVEYHKNGYLTEESVESLRVEILKNKAVSAYEYAIPIVGVYQWYKGLMLEEGYENGDFVVYNTRTSKMPVITSNDITPYVVTYVDLNNGPYVIEIPAGPIGGLVNNLYQVPESDLGVLGPDKGKGGAYLLVGPGQKIPADHNADYVVETEGNFLFVGTRIIGLKGEAYQKALAGHKIYKFGETKAQQKFITATEKPTWMGHQTRGMEFWEDLNAVLQGEPVVDRNRFILTQLRDLGMVKGQPFNPTQEQRRILIEAAEIGEAMAMVNTFSKRSYKSKKWPDKNWRYILNQKNLDHIADEYYEVKEIASYTYEAISTSVGMVLNNIGVGSKYIAAYVDENEQWLDGANTYVITVPPNAPVQQFWAVTVYDNDTRCMIVNDVGVSERTSKMDLKVEADGSTKVFVGPKAPKGYEDNWIQSNPKKGWFAYMRFYAPTEAYFDHSYVVPDFKQVD